jgi:hypothetical protein
MSGLYVPRHVIANGTPHAPGDKGSWHCAWEVKKYWGDHSLASREDGLVHPYEIVTGEGNVLITTGVNTMLNALIGTAITAYSNANCRLGVGDSATAPTAADTDLNAATNKTRQLADATYPSIATNVMTIQATFATGAANYSWLEWGTFNTASAGSGMLNHANPNLGTKTSAAAWALKVTITVA